MWLFNSHIFMFVFFPLSLHLKGWTISGAHPFSLERYFVLTVFTDFYLSVAVLCCTILRLVFGTNFLIITLEYLRDKRCRVEILYYLFYFLNIMCGVSNKMSTLKNSCPCKSSGFRTRFTLILFST